MDIRRTFWPYAAAGFAAHFSDLLLVRLLASTPLAVLTVSPLSYALEWLVASGLTWLIAPRETKGAWIATFGAGVLLASLMLPFVMTFVPGAEPHFMERGLLRTTVEVLLWAFFVVVLWVVWLATAKQRLRSAKS